MGRNGSDLSIEAPAIAGAASTAAGSKRKRSEDGLEEPGQNGKRHKRATDDEDRNEASLEAAADEQTEIDLLLPQADAIEALILLTPENAPALWSSLAGGSTSRNRSAKHWELLFVRKVWPLHCRKTWQTAISEAEMAEERSMLRGCRLVMEDLALAEHNTSMSPAFFLLKLEWKKFIEQEEDISRQLLLRDLQQLMYQQVARGDLERPRTPRHHLFVEAWQRIYDDSPQVDKHFWNAMQWRMRGHVGKRALPEPLSPKSYLHWDAWEQEISDAPSRPHKAGLRRIRGDMHSDVLDRNRLPRSPVEVFHRQSWETAIARADKGYELACVQDEMERHTVLNDERPYSFETFEWMRGWSDLNERMNASVTDEHAFHAFEKAYEDVMRAWRKWDVQIILPSVDNSMSPLLQCALLKDHVKSNLKAKAIAAWGEAIDDEADEERKLILQKDRDLILKRYDEDLAPVYWPHDKNRPIDMEHIAHTIGFDNDTIPGHWEWDGALGQGVYGFAARWVRLSSSGRILDRIATKDTYNVWGSVQDHSGPKWSGEIPSEYLFVRLLQAMGGSEGIIRYRASKTYERHKMYRIYMENCKYGSLEGLIKAYRENNARGARDQDGNLLNAHIPERQLWSILESFASALCLMHYGALPNQPQNPTWIPICHQDFKPANVLMATESSHSWPELPVTKVADWGLVARMGTFEPEAPGHGDPKYFAPEAIPHDGEGDELASRIVTQASDIWCAGRVMLCLMNLETADEMVPRAFEFESRHLYPPFKPGVQARYSKELCDVVRACLEKFTLDRIEARELWREVEERVRGWKGQEPGEGEVLYHFKRSDVRWGR